MPTPSFYAIANLVFGGWFFYRLFIAKTFFLWTWKDGPVRLHWPRQKVSADSPEALDKLDPRR